MKHLAAPLFTIVFLLAHLGLHAQDWATIKAMEEALAEPEITNHERVDALLRMVEAYCQSYSYRMVSADSALAHTYALKAMALARQANYVEGLAQGRFCLGLLAIKGNALPIAKAYFDSVFAMASQHPHLQQQQAFAHYGMATLAYAGYNYPAATQQAQQALALSQRYELWNLEARARLLQGLGHQRQNEHAQALESFYEAERIWHLANENPYIPDLYMHMSLSLWYQNRYAEDLNYLNLSYQSARQYQDTALQLLSTIRIGLANHYLADPATAIAYFRKGLAMVPNKPKWSFWYNACLNNIGHAYFESTPYLDSAQIYLDSALSLNLKGKQWLKVASNYDGLGETELKRGNHQLAATHLEKGLASLDSLKLAEPDMPASYGKATLAALHTNLGRAHMGQGNQEKALHYFEQGFINARNYGTIYLLPATQGLAKAHAANGQYKMAYDYQVLFTYLKDSVSASEGRQVLARLSWQEASQWKSDSLVLAAQLQNAGISAAIQRQRLLALFWVLGGVFGIGLLVTFVLLLRMKA